MVEILYPFGWSHRHSQLHWQLNLEWCLSMCYGVCSIITCVFWAPFLNVANWDDDHTRSTCKREQLHMSVPLIHPTIMPLDWMQPQLLISEIIWCDTKISFKDWELILEHNWDGSTTNL